MWQKKKKKVVYILLHALKTHQANCKTSYLNLHFSFPPMEERWDGPKKRLKTENLPH